MQIFNALLRLACIWVISLIFPLALAQEVSLARTSGYPVCGQRVNYTCTTTDTENEGFAVEIGETGQHHVLGSMLRIEKKENINGASTTLTITLAEIKTSSLISFDVVQELNGLMLHCASCRLFDDRGCTSRSRFTNTPLINIESPAIPRQQNTPIFKHLATLKEMHYHNIANGNHDNTAVFAGLTYSSPQADNYTYTLSDGTAMVSATTNSTQIAVGPVEPNERWSGTVQSLNCWYDGTGEPSPVAFGRYLITTDIQCPDFECAVDSTLPLVSVIIMTGKQAVDESTLTEDHYRTTFTFTLPKNESSQNPGPYNATFIDEFDGEYLATLTIIDPVNANTHTQCNNTAPLQRWAQTGCWSWQEYALIAGAGVAIVGVTVTTAGILIYTFRRKAALAGSSAGTKVFYGNADWQERASPLDRNDVYEDIEISSGTKMDTSHLEDSQGEGIDGEDFSPVGSQVGSQVDSPMDAQ